MDKHSRLKWSVPLKAAWPRKPNLPDQYVGIPLVDTKGTLVALIRPVTDYESDPAYHNRIGQALLDARHTCKLHNADSKKPKEASRASSNRKASSANPSKSIRLDSNPTAESKVHTSHTSGDFHDW